MWNKSYVPSAKQLQLSKHSAHHLVVHWSKMASHIQLMLSVGYVNTLDVSENVKFADSFFKQNHGENWGCETMMSSRQELT